MTSIRDLPKQERPREKLVELGSRALSDQELLAIILGRGTQKHDVMSLSRRIIAIIDIQGVDITAADLLDVEGIGPAKATLIAAAFEFVRRRVRPEGVRIKHPTDVLPLIQHYADRKQEHFIVVSLNGAHEVMSTRVVTIGLVDQSHVHPREVFSDPITERASAIVLAHNHPSGQLVPSPEDLDVTHRIKVAGDILGIEVLDHVLFTHKGFYSFAEHDQL
ncbi:MAG: DNA repair protein RadC [Planctomycetes bacterium]|nr:DNA repair protein RadC [Planctomycetota bacterium]